MATRGVLLVQAADGWQLSAIGKTADEHLESKLDQADELVDRIEQFIDQHGLTPQVVIAIDSQHALSASFEVQADDARYRNSLQYELEEWLPWAAEETAADFRVTDGRLFGVGIDLDQWLPLVLELERRRIKVQSITPAVLLALQHLLAGDAEDQMLLWPEAHRLHLVRIHAGKPDAWRTLAAATEVPFEIEQLQNGSPPAALKLVGTDDPLAEELSALAADPLKCSGMSDHLHGGATAILNSQMTPWIELRQNELAAGDPHRRLRAAIRALAVAASVLFVSWIGVFGLKTWKNYQHVESLRQQQVDVYKQTFPDTRVPAGVLSRIRSEHTRRTAARQAPQDVQLPISALPVLHDFLSGLPVEMRYRTREFRIENGELDMDSDLKAHSAANQLAEALRNHGFEVPAPTTVASEDQVISARLYATWKGLQEKEPQP